MKKDRFNEKFLCHAANGIDGLNYGAVGEVQPLIKWLEDLFPSHRIPFEDFFDGYSKSEILDYIYTHKGLRLTTDFQKYL